MHKLNSTQISPVYLALELRGDRFDSNAVHHYLPEQKADGAFVVPARNGLEDATLFVHLGRVMPGPVEIETDAPESTDLEFGLGEWARGFVPTPFGTLRIKWQLEPYGQIVLDYAAPNGIDVIAQGTPRQSA